MGKEWRPHKRGLFEERRVEGRCTFLHHKERTVSKVG